MQSASAHVANTNKTIDLGAEISRRLKFLRFTEADRAALVAFRPALVGKIDGILDRFYEHIRAHGHLYEKFRTDANMQRAKSAQKQHWMTVFSGQFDATYADRVRRIGEAHERIGLEPSWYIGGYTMALNEISQVVQQKYRWHVDKASTVLAAVQKAVMLDLELSISVYQEAVNATHKRTLERLAGSFEGCVMDSVQVVAQQAAGIGAQATGLSEATGQSSDRLSAVAAASEQASANVQTVASAAEELAASIAEITRQVTQSTAVAQDAVAEAEKTSSAVTALSGAADKIGKIIELINAVARQTNLLALNATIEAARAGEAGKGFAVVAAEVKALANQTSRATGEIEEEVKAMRNAAQASVEAISRISGVISRMNDVSSAIAAAVEEQGAATSEIARNVQEVATGTAEVSSHVVGLKEVVHSVSETSREVLTACQALNSTFDKVKVDVREFVTTIRTS